jgi:hypothetical protein
MCHVGELEHAEKIEYCTTKPDKTRSLYIISGIITLFLEP